MSVPLFVRSSRVQPDGAVSGLMSLPFSYVICAIRTSPVATPAGLVITNVFELPPLVAVEDEPKAIAAPAFAAMAMHIINAASSGTVRFRASTAAEKPLKQTLLPIRIAHSL